MGWIWLALSCLVVALITHGFIRRFWLHSLWHA